MKAYDIEYKMHSADKVHTIAFLAKNKADAWDRAVYEEIPKVEDGVPYSAWVAGVTYQNGNYRRFNTFEGNPY